MLFEILTIEMLLSGAIAITLAVLPHPSLALILPPLSLPHSGLLPPPLLEVQTSKQENKKTPPWHVFYPVSTSPSLLPLACPGIEITDTTTVPTTAAPTSTTFIFQLYS